MRTLLLSAGIVAALFAAPHALASSLSFGALTANQKVRPQDHPAASSSVKLLAAKNEFEPFQIVVASTGGATSAVSARVSTALAGPGGARIPDANVTFYRAAYYDVGVASNSEGAAGLWPDALVPDVDTYVGEKRNAFPFDVPDGESRVVWVDVLVPADAASGDYAGAVELSAGGAVLGTIAVSLHVGSFALPSTATLTSAFGMGWADPCIAHTGDNYCGDPSGVKAPALRALYLRAGLEHRFSISSVDFQPPFGSDQAPFEKSILPLVAGNGPTRLAGAKITAVQLDGSASTLSSWISYAKTQSFFDRLFYYPVDEPGTNASSWSNLVSAAAQVHGIDANASIIITGTLDEATTMNAAASVDTFVPVINAIEDRAGGTWAGDQRPKYDAWLAATPRHKLWAYQSCMSHGCGGCGDATTDAYFTGWPQRVIDSSAVQDRCQPWLSFGKGISGELYFDTTYQLSTAWSSSGQCAFSGSGDGTIFYPGKPSVIGGTTDIPVESIRMKMIREGMEDYEYLVLAAAKDGAKAHAIEGALFPHAFACAQPASALESARAALFAMLDVPAPTPPSSGGDAGSGGGPTGGGGVDGGAGAGEAGDGGGAATPPSATPSAPGTQTGESGGCAMAGRAGGGDGGAWSFLFATSAVGAAVVSRRRRRIRRRH